MKDFELNDAQLQKIKTQPGFIAALDQSGGSTPGALRAYVVTRLGGTALLKSSGIICARVTDMAPKDPSSSAAGRSHRYRALHQKSFCLLWLRSEFD